MNTHKYLSLVLNILLGIFILAAGALCYYTAASFFNSSEKKVADETPSESSTISAYNSGDLDQAIKDAEALVQSGTNKIQALLLLASSYAQKGSIAYDETTYGEKAIAIAKQVLALEPNDIDASQAYGVIGYANEIMQKYDEARLNYDKAIALNANNAQAHSSKGHSYDLQGNLVDADIWYKKALAIDPNNEHALLNQTRMILRTPNVLDARAMANKLISVSKNKLYLAQAHQMLAFMDIYLEKTPNYADALVELNRSVGYSAQIPQTWIMLADVHINDYIKSMLNLAPEQELKVKGQAVWNDINKALAINPNQASAYYYGAQMALFDGDKAKQAEYLKKANAAVPLDITLGTKEKAALLDLINSTSVEAK